jgi:hypothetical protein
VEPESHVETASRGQNVSTILVNYNVLLREDLCCNMHLRVTFPLLGAGLALGLNCLKQSY